MHTAMLRCLMRMGGRTRYLAWDLDRINIPDIPNCQMGITTKCTLKGCLMSMSGQWSGQHACACEEGRGYLAARLTLKAI